MEGFRCGQVHAPTYSEVRQDRDRRSALPRGVIVGTVELHDCDGDEWQFREPKRAKRLRKPNNHPMPVWFTPFKTKD